MHEKLLRSLKDQRENRLHQLKMGAAKDYAEYKALCAELMVLDRVVEEIQHAIAEDDE